MPAFTLPIRYRHVGTGQSYIVDPDDHVYKASGQEIRLGDRIEGAEAQALVDARRAFFASRPQRLFGIVHEDFSPRGPLGVADQATFARGEPVSASRSDLAGHMDYFDTDNDGLIGFIEGRDAWQALGYGKDEAYQKQRGVILAFYLIPLIKSFFGFSLRGLAAFFGTFFRLRRGATDDGVASSLPSISVDGIFRPGGATGVYGEGWNIDEKKYAAFVAPFAKAADDRGVLSQAKAAAILGESQKLGVVPKGQFKTLFELASKMNDGEPDVSVDQLRWAYDGSLAWRALALRGWGAS